MTQIENLAKVLILPAYSPAGLTTYAQLTTLPASGVLTELDSYDSPVQIVTPSMLPHTLQTHRLSYQPTLYSTDSVSFSFKGIDEVGGESEESSVTVSIVPSNDLPTAEPVVAEIPKGAAIHPIELPVMDPDNTFVNVVVSALPVVGTLYYVDSKSTGVVEQFNDFSMTEQTVQYAAAVLEASSYYPDNNVGFNPRQWHPDNVLGEKDCEDVKADCSAANSFNCKVICEVMCGKSITTGGAGGQNG